MVDTVFENFDDEAAQLWSNHPLKLRHRLHERDIFTDEKLGALLDRIPGDQVTITTMDGTVEDVRSWAHCDRGDLSGEELVRAVAQGRIWINLSSIHRLAPEFDALLEEMFGAIGARMPELKVLRKSMGLLISSPGARVFYHADVPGQSLWQIRGEKRIYIYPNSQPFLKAKDLENIVRRRTEEDLPYEPWFDRHAEIVDLKPGDMVHWPLNGPHRVENKDCLNISLTTEHWTPEIMRHVNVQYGNGILRDAGLNPRTTSLYGPSALFKAGLAKAWWLSGQQKRQRFRPVRKYRLDRSHPGLLVPLEPQPQLIAAE